MSVIIRSLPLEIRLLTELDAAAWWRLRLQALEGEPGAFGSSAEDHRQTTIESAAARIATAGQGSFILGAFVDQDLAGVAGCHREQESKSRHKGWVWGVYVAEPFRRCGIGRVLMRTLIERARSQPGLLQITLTVATQQAAAGGLYASLGFQPFGREPRALCVDGQYLDEDYLILVLG